MGSVCLENLNLQFIDFFVIARGTNKTDLWNIIEKIERIVKGSGDWWSFLRFYGGRKVRTILEPSNDFIMGPNTIWSRIQITERIRFTLFIRIYYRSDKTKSRLARRKFFQKTNEQFCFVCFAFWVFTANDTNSFVRFLGESMARQSWSRFI